MCHRVLRSLSLKGVKTASDATDRLLQLVIGQSGATAASTESIAVAATAASALATALADSGEFLSTAAGTRKNVRTRVPPPPTLINPLPRTSCMTNGPIRCAAYAGIAAIVPAAPFLDPFPSAEGPNGSARQ